MTALHPGDAVTVTSHCYHHGRDECGRHCTVLAVHADDLPDQITLLTVHDDADDAGDKFPIWADEVQQDVVSAPVLGPGPPVP